MKETDAWVSLGLFVTILLTAIVIVNKDGCEMSQCGDACHARMARFDRQKHVCECIEATDGAP